MMLSTIAKSRPLLSQLSAFAFAEARTQQGASLNQQILQTKSWKEFLKLFTDKKQEFTQETFHFSSRYVNHLLLKQKQHIRYTEFNEIVRAIDQLETQTLTQTHIISLLAILRVFSYRGLDVYSFFKLKTKLCSRYTELLGAKPEGKENFSEMIYAYYEMVYFNWHFGTRLISERILNRFKSAGENTKILSLGQDQYLLNAIAHHDDLSYQQCRLRYQILKDINEGIDEVRINDVVNILVSINKMSFHDASKNEYSFVKNIGNKVLENMNELEEKSIFQFLRGNNRNNHPIFRAIYEELLKNSFAEISEDGSTNFDNKLMLRLFSSLSARCNFSKFGQIEKTKFHTFLNACIDQFTSKNDTQGIKILTNFIEDIVENRFFDQNKNQQLVTAVHKLGVPLRQRLLQLLYITKADISELIPSFLAQSFSENSSVSTVLKYSTFVKKLISNKKYAAHKQALESHLSHFSKKLDETFGSPEKFTQAFSIIFKNPEYGVNLPIFHYNHEEYFQRLPNPFEIENQNYPTNYKSLYLQYVLYSFRQDQIYKFINKYISKINNSAITRVIFSNITEENNPNKFLLNLAARNILQAINSKEKEFINSTLELVGKYSRYIVRNGRDPQMTRNVLKILSICFEKVDILKELFLKRNFSTIFNKYVNKNSGNYKNQSFFREIVILGLKNLKILTVFNACQVLKEGLRLNIVQKKHLQGVQFQSFNLMNYFDKQSLLYIRDPTHKPEIKAITSSSLHAIFFNHNLQSLIEAKQTQINEVLQRSSMIDLLGYLAVFNQPKSKLSLRIVVKIMSLIVSSQKYIERGDFFGAIKNLLEKNFNNTRATKQFAQKVVNLLSIKTDQFSLSTHFEAIRFAISIPTYNPQAYYKKLVEYSRKNFRDIDYEEVLFKLAFTNYEFKPEQLKHVKNLIKRNVYRGVYLFLATENQHSEQERKQIVSLIVTKLKESKESDSLIHAIQFSYLKASYPEETKDLQLKPEQLQNNPLFIKPNQKVLAVLQQIAKANQTNLQVLPDFQQNYLAKINNICFVFFNSKRTGSYHEHQFLRRALPLHFKEQNYQYVFLGPVSASKVIEFIEKQVPQIITPEVKQAVSILIQKSNNDKTEELGQEKPQTKKQNRPKRERKPRQQKTEQN